MPVIITLPEGRPKRDIITMAREECGQAGYEFGLEADEAASDLRKLNTLMGIWPWNTLGYDNPVYGDGSPEDASGLSPEAIPAVVGALAMAIAPGMGKTLSPEQRATQAKHYSQLCAQATTIPTQAFPPGTVRGSGSRRSAFITEAR